MSGDGQGEERLAEDAREADKEREPRPSTNSLSNSSRQKGDFPFLLADLFTASHDIFRDVNC